MRLQMWKWLEDILFAPESEQEDLEYNEDHILFWIKIGLIMAMVAALVGAVCYVSS